MQVDGDQGQSLCSTHTVPDLAEWLSFSTWHHMSRLSLEQKLEVIDQAQFELLYDTKEAVDVLLGGALLLPLTDICILLFPIDYS